jgi:hypothetical protein
VEVVQASTRIAPATRVPGAPRGGHARRRPRARVSPSLERFGPRLAPSTRVERGVRKPSRAGRGSQAPRAVTHCGGRRNRHRLVPASSGAKAPLACEDRELDGCARASYQVAEVGKRRRGSEKRDNSAGNGARGREPGPSRNPQGSSKRVKRSRGASSRRPSRAREEVRSRAPERAPRGEGSCQMEGVPDHARRPASSTRAGRTWSRRLSRVRIPRERVLTRDSGDRDARGSVCTRRDGNNKPAAVTPSGERATHRSESH